MSVTDVAQTEAVREDGEPTSIAARPTDQIHDYPPKTTTEHHSNTVVQEHSTRREFEPHQTMKKLQLPVRPIAHIVLPGHNQREVPTSPTTKSAASSADLGPLPGQLEFQNLFWTKTLVSLEGVSLPSPDRVWVRPPPAESPTALRIPKLPPPPKPPEPYRSPPRLATKERLGVTGLQTVKGSGPGPESRPSGRYADYPPTSARITVSRNHGDVPPPPTPGVAGARSPVIMLPAKIEFQDAFWGRIQVPTTKLNKEFIDSSCTFSSEGLLLSSGPG